MLLVLFSCTARWLWPLPVCVWVAAANGATVCCTSAMFWLPFCDWFEVLSSAMTWPAKARTIAALRGASLNMVEPPGLSVLGDLNTLAIAGLGH